MDEVLVLGEEKDQALDPTTLELLGIGNKLANDLGGQVSVALLGDDISDLAEKAAAFGPARVYKIEHPLLKNFIPDLWLSALDQACRQINPKIFLMAHDHKGMELGPRLAYRLETKLTTDCIDLSIDPSTQLMLRTKPVSGGNAISVLKCAGDPQMATVRPKVFEAAQEVQPQAEVIDIALDLDESLVKVESIEVVKEDVVSLDKANVVISGGAGLGDEEGFEVLEDLANVLSKWFGNVMIGCSRVAVDKGWMSSDHQVGLTGSMISPDIYVAVGISGAIQHLVGMIHSKKIIAINTDRDCNMFKVADYGVVDDYEDVIPALIKKLEEAS